VAAGGTIASVLVAGVAGVLLIALIELALRLFSKRSPDPE
jgi:hypothetical protein